MADDVMVFPMFLYFERNISCNFDGLTTISLSLSHCIAVFVTSFTLLEMVSKFLPTACASVLKLSNNS